MILSVPFQMEIFLTAIVVGFLIGFFYDFLRIFRIFVYHNNFFINFEDILFCLSMSLFVFFISIYKNNGEIRMFFILGIFFGIALYIVFFSKIFIKFSNEIISFVKKIINLIIVAILMPIKIILFPFISLFKFFKKSLQNTKLYEIIYNKLNNIKIHIKNIKGRQKEKSEKE